MHGGLKTGRDSLGSRQRRLVEVLVLWQREEEKDAEEALGKGPELEGLEEDPLSQQQEWARPSYWRSSNVDHGRKSFILL